MKLMRASDSDEMRRFLDDVRKFGITQLREGVSLEDWEKGVR